MRKILATILAVGLAACSGTPAVLLNNSIPVVQNDGLPAPTMADSVGGTRPYRIGAFDELSVNVFGAPELSAETVRASGEGDVSLPLIGSIPAAGLTTAELERLIAARLVQSYVRDPKVSVGLKEAVSQKVTVDGQVARPGVYPVLGETTLMQSIATAGGVGEFAKLEDVVILRDVGGRRMAGLYNLASIRAGYYDDPQVYARDTIIVGDSKARRLFTDAMSVAPLLTTPLILLLQSNP